MAQATTSGALDVLGHPVYRMDLELPRGTTQTVVLHLQEPAIQGNPVIWRQPGVTPEAVTAFAQPGGRRCQTERLPPQFIRRNKNNIHPVKYSRLRPEQIAALYRPQFAALIRNFGYHRVSSANCK